MAKHQTVGYIRVSSIDQNTDRQLDGLTLDKIFTDKASGKDTHRPALEALKDHVRDGDVVVVHSMDRLARNLDDLRKIVRELTDKGVRVQFHKEGQTFSSDESPMSQLMLNLMGSFAEFERSLIKERQAEGIAAAKRRGVYKGRKSSVTPEIIAQIKARVTSGEAKAAIARELGISRETVYQYLKR